MNKIIEHLTNAAIWAAECGNTKDIANQVAKIGNIEVKIKKLRDDAVIPTYAKDGDMGMDLTAVEMEYKSDIDCFVYHTGLAFELPKGYGMLLFPRSSNRKTDAYMTNHVGILDSGYRGELLICYKNRTDIKNIGIMRMMALLVNNLCERAGFKNRVPVPADKVSTPYNVGDRIAQLVILPYPQVKFTEVDELSESERGKGGHGSTGK